MARARTSFADKKRAHFADEKRARSVACRKAGACDMDEAQRNLELRVAALEDRLIQVCRQCFHHISFNFIYFMYCFCVLMHCWFDLTKGVLPVENYTQRYPLVGPT